LKYLSLSLKGADLVNPIDCFQDTLGFEDLYVHTNMDSHIDTVNFWFGKTVDAQITGMK